MSAIKFLDPKNDYAFKRIFGTEKNKDILVHFLNKILSIPDPIQTVKFLKTLQDPEARAKKQSIVDVLCQDEKGMQYIVEMQVARSDSFVKRAQFYAAKAYTNQLNNGEDYRNLKQVIFLAITNFVMFPDKPEFKSDHVILDRDSFANDLKDFSFTFLELPKFKKEIDELRDDVDRWMYFFKHATDTNPDQLEKLISEDRMIDRAYHVLDQYYWSADERAIYESEQKSERDGRAILLDALTTGRSEGLAEGMIKAKRETAHNLLSLGMEIQVVASVTGLAREDLEDLRDESSSHQNPEKKLVDTY